MNSNSFRRLIQLLNYHIAINFNVMVIYMGYVLKDIDTPLEPFLP